MPRSRAYDRDMHNTPPCPPTAQRQRRSQSRTKRNRQGSNQALPSARALTPRHRREAHLYLLQHQVPDAGQSLT